MLQPTGIAMGITSFGDAMVLHMQTDYFPLLGIMLHIKNIFILGSTTKNTTQMSACVSAHRQPGAPHRDIMKLASVGVEGFRVEGLSCLRVYSTRTTELAMIVAILHVMHSREAFGGYANPKLQTCEYALFLHLLPAFLGYGVCMPHHFSAPCHS